MLISTGLHPWRYACVVNFPPNSSGASRVARENAERTMWPRKIADAITWPREDCSAIFLRGSEGRWTIYPERNRRAAAPFPLNAGRKCFILTERVEHCAILLELIRQQVKGIHAATAVDIKRSTLLVVAQFSHAPTQLTNHMFDLPRTLLLLYDRPPSFSNRFWDNQQ